MGRKLDDLTGRKFNRLTVIEKAGNDKYGHPKWKCICDCGNETIVLASQLRTGNTKSCGCLVKETNVKLRTTHGMKKSRIYRTWINMKVRCTYQKDKCYKDYGGRGITVCSEWMDSFQAFYDWAMKNGYNDDLTIDRKDVNGNYCPENCKWITMAEQQKNKRNSKKRG